MKIASLGPEPGVKCGAAFTIFFELQGLWQNRVEWHKTLRQPGVCLRRTTAAACRLEFACADLQYRTCPRAISRARRTRGSARDEATQSERDARPSVDEDRCHCFFGTRAQRREFTVVVEQRQPSRSRSALTNLIKFYSVSGPMAAAPQ